MAFRSFTCFHIKCKRQNLILLVTLNEQASLWKFILKKARFLTFLSQWKMPPMLVFLKEGHFLSLPKQAKSQYISTSIKVYQYCPRLVVLHSYYGNGIYSPNLAENYLYWKTISYIGKGNKSCYRRRKKRLHITRK